MLTEAEGRIIDIEMRWNKDKTQDELHEAVDANVNRQLQLNNSLLSEEIGMIKSTNSSLRNQLGSTKSEVSSCICFVLCCRAWC